MRLFGNNPVALTVAKMAAVVVIMFSFVFVVMVPLYNVLCDALGINGKTSGERYEAAAIQVDESREITVQFIATNSDGMPWDFRPSLTSMQVNPGALNETVFLARNPGYGCPGNSEHFAVPGRGVFSQDRVLLLQQPATGRATEYRNAAAVHRRPGPAAGYKDNNLVLHNV